MDGSERPLFFDGEYMMEVFADLVKPHHLFRYLVAIG